MPIVGKKIAIGEIVGVAKPDIEEIKGRENRAVAATAVGILGAALGGKTGNAISFGAAGGSVVSDFVSRNKVSKQRIKCEISEY